MSDGGDTKGNNAALIEFAKDVLAPEQLLIKRGNSDTAPVIAIPQGMRLATVKAILDDYLPAPERKRGTAKLTTLAAFIAHTNRFKDADSVVFADDNPDAPKLLSVLDYHKQDGSPRFGEHRGLYAFPLSEDWKAWADVDGKELSQAQFAQFIEERILDVVDPKQVSSDAGGDKLWDFAEGLGILVATRTQLVELSRGLSINKEAAIAEHHDLTSGESRLRFETKHKDATGAPLVVPGGFCIAIPVFRGDGAYRLAVRLRHRVMRSGAGDDARDKVLWTIAIYRGDAALGDAFDRACAEVAAKTSLPVIAGEPES